MRPLILLVNTPVPLPSVVWLSAMVGKVEALQHTPFIVTAAPPSLRTLPPAVAVVVVILPAAIVVRVGVVIKLASSRRQRRDSPVALKLTPKPASVIPAMKKRVMLVFTPGGGIKGPSPLLHQYSPKRPRWNSEPSATMRRPAA